MALFLQAVVVILVAQGLIILGVGFISAHIFPGIFAKIYGMTSMMSRTLMTAVTVFPVANFLVAYGYGHLNPAHVAPLIFAFAVLFNVGFALFVLSGKFTWQLGLATMIVVAGSVWVSVLLQQNTA